MGRAADSMKAEGNACIILLERRIRGNISSASFCPEPVMGKKQAGIVIGVISVLLMVAAGLGIHFAVRNSGSGGNRNAGSTSPAITETDSSFTAPATVENDGSATANTPTGKRDRIAFLESGDIHVVELNGTGKSQLTNRGDIHDFVVSPSGKRIAFVASPREQHPEFTNALFEMRSDGTDVSPVVESGQAVIPPPAFDPTSEYIYYFNPVRPGSRPDVPGASSDVLTWDLERFHVETGNLNRVYTLSVPSVHELRGLWADPSGGGLYYNLGNRDPSGVPHRITLRPQVMDSVYMPRKEDSSSNVYYMLSGVSMNGTYVSYSKSTFRFRSGGTAGSSAEHVCYGEASGSGEKIVSTWKRFPADSELKFSAVSDNTYYYAKAGRSEKTGYTALRFFSGTTAYSSPRATGLILFPKYSPLIWQLMATE